MRNLQFAEKEFYHIFNRGVDKKVIFPAYEDMKRFFDGMTIFNSSEQVGSLERKKGTRRHSVSTGKDRLVNIIAYCLNPNHYHLILEQIGERGIERFMHKLGMGHSKYINTKYRRSGALFQGSFKAVHIDTNEYLLHVSAYVNLNNRVHNYRHGVSTQSSWDEYIGSTGDLCTKSIILEQFKRIEDYKKFAESTLEDITKRKGLIKELEGDNIELVQTI